MSDLFRRIAFGALIAGGLAFAPAVYAQQSASGADRTPSLMGGMQGSATMGMRGDMMDGNDRKGSRDENGGRSGMTGMMMGGVGQMMDGCGSMMQSHNQPPNSQFHKPSQQPQTD